MRLARFKILTKIQTLQKSQKKVFYQTLLRISLVWLVAFCVLGYICWSNRAATESNTYTVYVPGESISLYKKVHDAPNIEFQAENCTYYATWRAYAPQNVSFIVQDMMNEDQLTLTVLRNTDGRVVAINGQTREYLGMEAYNHWHGRNMVSGICATMILAVILTFLFGINILKYVR